MAKKLPIGIQSVCQILEEDQIYIDKTHFALQLIDQGKHYFISRPRRFGKSLFLNTLEEIFKGNKELFKNCAIYKSDYEWKKYPIVYLDFAKIANRTTDQLESALKVRLEIIANEHNVSIITTDIQVALDRLVVGLFSKYKRKIVILIDEYDKPIIDRLSDVNIAKQNKDLMKGFYGTLKGLDKQIHFSFITGISKFSQVSLFSGLNNLDDITIDPQYETLMGYTEKEFVSNLKAHIQNICSEKNMSEEEVVDVAREWYNGYCFSRGGRTVYNPFSTLQYMNKKQPANYWYSTGTPSFLIEAIKKHPTPSKILSGAAATENQLMNISKLENVDLIPLMYQTGYLTIQKYIAEDDYYLLDFPNKEVKGSFFNSLLEDFAGINPLDVTRSAKEITKGLEALDLDLFFKTINTYFITVPYQLLTKGKENLYHAIFLIILQVLGLKVCAEVATSIGRVDLVVELNQAYYIFELKLDQTAKAALAQGKAMKYKEKYRGLGKQLILLGVNFSSKSHAIDDWEGELFSLEGNLLKHLTKEH